MAFPVRISTANRADVGLQMGPWLIGGALYSFVLNGSAPIRMGFAKSLDGGATWTFQDSANAPSVSANPRYSVVQLTATTFRLVYGDNSLFPADNWGNLHYKDFDTATDTFGAQVDSTILWSPGGIADPAPSIVAQIDSAGVVWVVFVDHASVSTSKLRYVDITAGVWGTPADITSIAANTTVQPATATIDVDDVLHLVYIGKVSSTYSLLYANINAGVITGGQVIKTPLLGGGVYVGPMYVINGNLQMMVADQSGAFSNIDTLKSYIGTPRTSATPVWSTTSPDTNTYPAGYNYQDMPLIYSVGGTVFATWSVFEFGTPLSQVWYSVSADGGNTWSAPTLLYDAVANPPSWTSAGTVNELSFNATAGALFFTGNINSDGTATLGEVALALAISCNNPPDGTVGIAYDHPLLASGGTPPYTYAIFAGALPDGLSLDTSTGVISGTPTTAGTFPFTAQVTDADMNTAFVECSITINAAPLTLSCNNPPNGEVGVAYDHFLLAEGGTPPYTYAITVGALPDGLNLDTTTGEISGTPTVDGTFPFTAEVTDADTNTATVECSIIIDPAGELEVSCNNPPNGVVGDAYSHDLSASGGIPPYTWSITAGALPTGLSLDPTTGVISGTPTVAGAFNFTVTVTDSSGATTSATAYAIDALSVAAQNANWVQANKGPWFYNSNRYVLTRNGSDLQFYESADNGQTWATYGATQTIGNGFGFFRNYDAVEALDGSNVWICWINAGALASHGELIVQSFDLATATWGAVSTGGPEAYFSNGADDDTAGSAMLTQIAADDFGLIYRPVFETIAGSTHWTSSVYVGGSSFKLSAAIGAVDSTISVFLSESSLSAPVAGNYIEVDSETILINVVTPTATGYDLDVSRGQFGTTGASHAQYALCTEATAGAVLALSVNAGDTTWRLNGISYTPTVGHTVVCEQETVTINVVTPLGGGLYDCDVTRGTFLTTASAHSSGRLVSRVTTTSSDDWDRTAYVRYTSGVWGTPVAIGGDTNELQDYTPHGVVTGDGVDVAFMVSVVKQFPYPGATYTLNLYARTIDHTSGLPGTLTPIASDLAWGPNIEESASMPTVRTVSGSGDVEVSLGYIRPYAGYPQSDANNLQPMEASAVAVEPLVFTLTPITSDESVSVSGNPVKAVSIKGNGTTKYAVWVGQNPDPPYTLYYNKWEDSGGVWGTPVALYTDVGVLQTATGMLISTTALGIVFSQYPDVGTDELMYFELGFGTSASVECSISISSGGGGGGGGTGNTVGTGGGGSLNNACYECKPESPAMFANFLARERVLQSDLCEPCSPCDIGYQGPITKMPQGWRQIFPNASIALSSLTTGVETTVLTYTVPIGYDCYIQQLLNRFIGPNGGFINESGDIIWRLKLGRTYVPNYGQITSQLGDTEVPWGKEGLSILGESTRVFTYTVTIVDPSTLDPNGKVQCGMWGVLKPRRPAMLPKYRLN